MKTTKLADFFDGLREVIESAETPFSKLAVFALPAIAPLVPAFMTGLHMYQLLLEMLTFAGKEAWSFIMAFIVGLVLELLGYVGALMLIKSIFTLIRKGKDGYLIPAAINLFAYGFYLIIMYLLNVRLSEHFGVAKIVSDIVGMLSFITVPTGLLAANHLSQREIKEDDEKKIAINNDFKLKSKMIKGGMNPFAQEQVYQQVAPVANQKKSDWRQLDPEEKRQVKHVLSVRELLAKYNISKATAYAWKTDKYQE